MNHLLKFIVIVLFLFGLISCSSTKSIHKKRKPINSFCENEVSLIKNGGKQNPMRVFLINNPSDSILLNTSSKEVNVDSKDKILEIFVQRLYYTVTDSASLGVGIAAPQVGVLKKIIWVQRFDKEGYPFEVYFNPQIIKYSEKKQTNTEGCLSVPNRHDTLSNRSYAILLEYDKLDNSHQIEMIEGFTAVIFQHEIDHLNGIVFTEYID